MAASIVTRLPATLAGMAAGVIDRDRARAISNATLHLPDDLAAEADKIPPAPRRGCGWRTWARRPPGCLAGPRGRGSAEGRGAAGPAGGRRREDSGAASLSGRELDPADALAGKASI